MPLQTWMGPLSRRQAWMAATGHMKISCVWSWCWEGPAGRPGANLRGRSAPVPPIPAVRVGCWASHHPSCRLRAAHVPRGTLWPPAPSFPSKFLLIHSLLAIYGVSVFCIFADPIHYQFSFLQIWMSQSFTSCLSLHLFQLASLSLSFNIFSYIQWTIGISSFEMYLFMWLILILIRVFCYCADCKCLNTQDIWTKKTAEKKFKLYPSYGKQSSLKGMVREEI